VWVSFVVRKAKKPVNNGRTMKKTQTKIKTKPMWCRTVEEHLIFTDNHVWLQTFEVQLYFLPLSMLSFSRSLLHFV
jgi:hypothetical protein